MKLYVSFEKEQQHITSDNMQKQGLLNTVFGDGLQSYHRKTKLIALD